MFLLQILCVFLSLITNQEVDVISIIVQGMNPQNSVMVMVIMISSLVVTSDWTKVDVKECYKNWPDDCKFGLLKAICSDPTWGVCCSFIIQKKISEDCYFGIANDLLNNYPCPNPDEARSVALNMYTNCIG